MLTACKQYSPAAGATQGYIAYTQNVSGHCKGRHSNHQTDDKKQVVK